METSADRKAEPHPSKQYLIYEGVMSALHVFHMSCLTCTLNPSTAICLRAASCLDTSYKEIITSHCQTECAQHFFSLQPCLTSPSVQLSDVVLVDVGGGKKVLKHLVEIEFTPSKKLCKCGEKMEANFSDCRFSLSFYVQLFTAQPAACACLCLALIILSSILQF